MNQTRDAGDDKPSPEPCRYYHVLPVGLSDALWMVGENFPHSLLRGSGLLLKPVVRYHRG